MVHVAVQFHVRLGIGGGVAEIVGRLLRARHVTVGELAAEFDDRADLPTLVDDVGGIGRNLKFVLVLVPGGLAGRRASVAGDFDIHPVVAELGIELGFDGKALFGKGVMQEKRGGQTDRVIAARSFDPRIAVRGYRSEYAAAEFEGIALLADRGTLGTVAGAAEITLCIDRRGADFVFEDSFRGVGLDFVDRDLCRHGIAYRQGVEEG